MADKCKPVPEGYNTVTPYLVVDGASQLIDFVKKAFGAKEEFRMGMPGGKIAHAEVRIGDTRVMLADACGEWKAMPATLHLYVEDVDATWKSAVDAGGTAAKEVADQFYGDRSGGVRDMCGNLWWISSHIEDVPMEEIERRAKSMSTKAGAVG